MWVDEQLKVRIVVDKSDFNKGITDVKKELKLITDLQSDKSAFTKNIKIKKEDII